MKKYIESIFIITLLGLMMFGIVHAQSEITLNFSRDFGYSSGTGKIQGLFSMKVTSQAPLIEVDFYIDSKIIGKDKEEPYKIQFTTDDYPLGLHTLYAVGLTSDGRELKTREVGAEFVSAQEGNHAALSIIIPILSLVVIIAILSALIPAISSRKKGTLPSGSSRNYGLAGGTICSRCKRPYAMHMLAPNMLMGKLERCPHCGKWGIVRSYPVSKLREAEQAELEGTKNNKNQNNSGEEEYLRDIDDSKYQNL